MLAHRHPHCSGSQALPLSLVSSLQPSGHRGENEGSPACAQVGCGPTLSANSLSKPPFPTLQSNQHRQNTLEDVSQSHRPVSERFPRGCRFVEPQGLHLASIHISPLFLQPRAVAGTLAPSGPDSLPPDFAPCWKAPHPARGTLGSCSCKLPGFSPLRLSESGIANSSLPSAPAVYSLV